MITFIVKKFESKFGGYEGSEVYFVENGIETGFAQLKSDQNVDLYLNGIKDVLNHLGKKFEVRVIEIDY